jgi:hypothetical protein
MGTVSVFALNVGCFSDVWMEMSMKNGNVPTDSNFINVKLMTLPADTEAPEKASAA